MTALTKPVFEKDKPTKEDELKAYRERLQWIKLKVSDKCDYYLDPPERTTDVKDAEVYGFELLQCIDTRNLIEHRKIGKNLTASIDKHSKQNNILMTLDENNALKFIILDGTTIVASSERFDKKEDIALVDIFPNGYINVEVPDGLSCFYRHHDVDKLAVISLVANPVKQDNAFGPSDNTTYAEDERPVNFWVYNLNPYNYREFENRKDLTFAGLTYWVNYTGKYSENETNYPIIDGEIAAMLYNSMVKDLINRNIRPSILQRVAGDDLPF